MSWINSVKISVTWRCTYTSQFWAERYIHSIYLSLKLLLTLGPLGYRDSIVIHLVHEINQMTYAGRDINAAKRKTHTQLCRMKHEISQGRRTACSQLASRLRFVRCFKMALLRIRLLTTFWLFSNYRGNILWHSAIKWLERTGPKRT